MTKDELNICWRLNKKLGKLEEEYAAIEDSLLQNKRTAERGGNGR